MRRSLALPTRPTSDIVVAKFSTTARIEVRVAIENWRGRRKLRFQEYSPGPVAGTWWRSGSGVSLDLDLLPELIAALQRAERDARSRGHLARVIV
jgi:hypothetical protein